MSENKDVFMCTSELGDLFLYDVLLSYIYPRVFVCHDIFGCKYLFYEIESEDNYDKWLVTKITAGDYFNLLDRKKPIQAVYKTALDFCLFSLTKKYGNEDVDDDIEINYEEARKLIKILPASNVFVEKNIVDDIADETLIAARTSGATTFDIRFYPGEERHSISFSILSDIGKNFTSLLNSIFGQKRSESLQISTVPGSCVVRFSFPDQINLFNESAAINQMNIINRVFTSEALFDGIKDVQDRPKFIKAYAAFLGAIRRTGSDVQFTTASPNSTEIQKVELTRNTVVNRYAEFKDVYTVQHEIVKEKGTLIALDVKLRKFKLQSEDGRIIAGLIGDDFLSTGSIELPKLYDAIINIERYIDDDDTISQVKYCLINLL